MIIEFDQKKSTVTFGGGRFVSLFIHHGLINKSLELSVFEADENFRPVDPQKPLFMGKVPFDERKILNALTIIGGLDSGKAPWIPSKYVSNDHDSKEIHDLEEEAAQMAFGKASILLKRKDYEAALLNITASLLSEYLKKHPKHESRFLRKQAEAFVGRNNFFEAKKAILRAMEKYDEDSGFQDYFTLGIIEYKLSNKKEALDSLKKFIELAETFIKNSDDNNVREENKKLIETASQLINKLG